MQIETQVFKTLSDKTRLRIIMLLFKQELCVCELMKILETTQTKISRHLAYLKRNKLIKSRRDGLWMYYSIENQSNAFVTELFKLIKKSITNNKNTKADHQKLLSVLKQRNKNC